jgi:secreted trypsin-like serine protease
MKKRLLISLIFFFGIIFKLVSNTTYTCSSSASCGCSANSAVLTKIVGGETASSQTWGWAASLRYSSSGSHFCGGSVISDSHILTAAHCTIDLIPSSLRVYVGSIYLSSATQVRDVSKIYNHPSYSSSSYLNDMAILKLSSPLNLDQASVDLVCLPNVSSAVLASGEYPPAGISVMLI